MQMNGDSHHNSLLIGWRPDSNGNLEPVDEKSTASYSETIDSIRRAYLKTILGDGSIKPATDSAVVIPIKGRSNS